MKHHTTYYVVLVGLHKVNSSNRYREHHWTTEQVQENLAEAKVSAYSSIGLHVCTLLAKNLQQINYML